MKRPVPPGRRQAWARSSLAALAVAIGTAACGVSSAALPKETAAPSAATLLPTSVETSSGTFVAVPMGALDQPLNTFWQLFVLPPGGSRWSSTSSIGVATNGGLVLASSGGRSVVVGVRPSNLLSFSALASTSDGGRSWSVGLPVAALGSWTDALAAGPGGRLLALTGSGRSARVLDALPGATAWATLASEPSLQGSGRLGSCGPAALTAVAYSATTPLVGAACLHPGVVGLLADRSGSWRLTGPELSPSMRTGTVEVVAVEVRHAGLSVLLRVDGGAGTRLVAAFAPGLGGPWRLSPPLGLTSRARVVSIGPTGPGLFVLWSQGAVEHLDLASDGRTGWEALPSPPAGSATLAFVPGVGAEAITADNTLMKVFRLTASRKWRESQWTDVPIQYGSSS